MKWPLTFLVTGVAATALFFYENWRENPHQDTAPSAAVSAEKIPRATAASNTAPPYTTTRTVESPASDVERLTESRRNVFDSPNVFKTLQDIARHGSPDERDWGLHLLSSCAAQFLSPIAPTESASEASTGAPVNSEFTAARRNAKSQLEERCKGVKALTAQQRAQMKSELQSGEYSGNTLLRQLEKIASIEDGRWNNEQAQLITDSLYSGDPVVAREASWALLKVIDTNAPGGRERQEAAMLALAPKYLNFPLSQYEQLDACASQGWCDHWGDSDPSYKASAAVQKLAEKYSDALAAHSDARSIAAIR